MNQFVYWPYDEVRFERTDTGVIVKTPWLSAKIKLDDGDRKIADQISEKFESATLGPEDIPMLNHLLQGLSHLPFCYILPMQKFAKDQHVLADQSLLGLELKDFLTRLVGVASDGVALHPAWSNLVLSGMSRKSWDWDLDSALSFAKIGEKVHPESLFSVARRYHLIDVIDNQATQQSFADIQRLKGSEEFRQAAALMVRQNHFITQQCRVSLTEALKTAMSAAPDVEEFIQEENGHDLILGAALKSIVDDPETLEVTAAAKTVMQVLATAGRRNFLGFAMIVDSFERSTYEDTDPLAKLLQSGGLDKAGRFVNRHKEINDAGEHENVACGLLKHMAPVDVDYAREAMHMAELANLLINSVAAAALEIWRKSSSS
jgi:hypothetical protein